jgi:hypothetical protein
MILGPGFPTSNAPQTSSPTGANSPVANTFVAALWSAAFLHTTPPRVDYWTLSYESLTSNILHKQPPG